MVEVVFAGAPLVPCNLRLEARQHSNDYGFGSGRYGRSGGYGA